MVMRDILALPADRMPEAEVALRLANYLVGLPNSLGRAEVAIDGASVKLTKPEFPVALFLSSLGWKQVASEHLGSWRGEYQKGQLKLVLHAKPGLGDVVCEVGNLRIRAECKKGPLIDKKGNPEYGVLRGLIGQLMTSSSVVDHDFLVAAVPATNRFNKLRREWSNLRKMRTAGIHIVLVGRDGSVEGLELSRVPE